MRTWIACWVYTLAVFAAPSLIVTDACILAQAGLVPISFNTMARLQLALVPLALCLEVYLVRAHAQRRRLGYLVFAHKNAPWLRVPLGVACTCMAVALLLATHNPTTAPVRAP